MAGDDGGRPCGAVRYFGDGAERGKHWCHRRPGHRGEHHSDAGLRWSKNPHAARTRLDEHTPCDDCDPV